MNFILTIISEMQKGNFSFLILIAAIVQIYFMVLNTKANQKTKNILKKR